MHAFKEHLAGHNEYKLGHAQANEAMLPLFPVTTPSKPINGFF
jgi:hypothetical protein